MNVVHVFILIVNNVLGIGLLNIPYAAMHCGVSNLIIILTILPLITVITITILAYCSDISHSLTYEGAVREMFGSTAYRITAVALIVHAFASCIIPLVIIGDQWKEVFLFMAKDHYCIVRPWYMQKTFILPLTSVIFILPFCFLDKIEFLAYPSGLGVLVILYINILVVVKYFAISDIREESELSRSYDIRNISLAVAPLIFSYEGHLAVIPIYSSMTAKRLKTFCITVGVAISMCTVFYGSTGIFGFLTFGNSVTSNILLSYEPKTDILVAAIMLSLKTYTSYPILAFCGREAFLSLWNEPLDVIVEEKLNCQKKRRIIVSSVWFILSLVAALYMPFVGIIMRYEGVLAFLFVFIIPGLFLVFLKDGITTSLSVTITRLTLGSILVVVGVFMMILTLIQSIQTDIMYPESIRQDTSQYTC